MLKRAIIVAGGLGTRFLPATMSIPKEMLYLVDRPVLHYLLEEVYASGLREICFVVSPGKDKIIRDYFVRNPQRDEFFMRKDRYGLVGKLCDVCSEMRITFAIQEKPLGNGDALLSAPAEFQKEPCAIFWADDLWQGPRPALAQLIEAFEKVQAPVVALCRVPQERVKEYGIVMPGERLGRLVKLCGIIEKPSLEEAPSDLAVPGRYIITPQVFGYVRKTEPDRSGEVYFTDALRSMICDGHAVYGYELEGDWVACGDRLDFLKSTVKLAVAHPELGEDFRKFLQKFQV